MRQVGGANPSPRTYETMMPDEPMTFETLTATPEDFGSEQAFLALYLPGYIDRFNVTEDEENPLTIADIFHDEATANLRIHLRTVGNYPNPYGTYFDRSVTDYAPEWRRLLALQQLILVYEDADQGEGSLNRAKLKQYQREYKTLLLTVPTFLQGYDIGERRTRAIQL